MLVLCAAQLLLVLCCLTLRPPASLLHPLSLHWLPVVLCHLLQHLMQQSASLLCHPLMWHLLLHCLAAVVLQRLLLHYSSGLMCHLLLHVFAVVMCHQLLHQSAAVLVVDACGAGSGCD